MKTDEGKLLRTRLLLFGLNADMSSFLIMNGTMTPEEAIKKRNKDIEDIVNFVYKK